MFIEFFGRECPHCLAMEPFVRRLEESGVEVKKYEVWHNAENARLMEQYDPEGDFCGGVPFFVNDKTGRKICGEAAYEDLLRLSEE